MGSSCARLVMRLALVTMLAGLAGAPSFARTGGDGGGAAGTGGSGAGGGNSGGAPRGAATPLPAADSAAMGPTVRSLSLAAEVAIGSCGRDTPRCVADALDRYAAALRRITPQLPPRLRGLPQIVARAAARVRSARTREEAVAAVTDAIAAVHKTIALLKADDPITLEAETRAGAFVARTLHVADDKLETAIGL